MAKLDSLFEPRAIAVIGASETPGEGGYHLLRSFVRSKEASRFKGELYAVSANHDTVFGMRCHRRLTEIEGPVDYVVIAVPSESIPAAMDDCAEKQVRAVNVFSLGFSETGTQEGKQLQERIVAIARDSGIRLIGPNCLGLYYQKSGLVIDPGQPDESPHEGGISIVSQSNAAALGIYRLCVNAGLRVGRIASLGNSADLTPEEVIDYYAEDGETDIVLAYVESAKSGRALFDSLKKAGARKPVVILKGGLTDVGIEAAGSHTGALAAGMGLYQFVFRQTNAIHANSFDEVVDAALAVKQFPRVRGRRTAIFTVGGGPSVVTSDSAVRGGLDLVRMDEEAQAKLKAIAVPVRQIVTDGGTITRNPIDLGNSMMRPGTLVGAMEIVAAVPTIDVLVLLQNTENIVSSLRRTGRSSIEFFRGLLEKSNSHHKPLMLISRPPREEEDETKNDPAAVVERRQLEKFLTEVGMPIYPSIERASRAIVLASTYFEKSSARHGVDSRNPS